LITAKIANDTAALIYQSFSVITTIPLAVTNYVFKRLRDINLYNPLIPQTQAFLRISVLMILRKTKESKKTDNDIGDGKIMNNTSPFHRR
jgi:hypothetical protein